MSAAKVKPGTMRESAQDLFSEPQAVSRRVWRAIVFVVILGSVVAAVFGNGRFAAGVLTGGLLALLNYRWLLSSVRGILDIAGPKAPPGTTMMFMLRWMVVAAIGYVCYAFGHLSPAGMVAGLLAPAVAAVIEAAYLGYKVMANGDALATAELKE